MIRFLRRVFKAFAYTPDMSHAHFEGYAAPVQLPEGSDGCEGYWVAVRQGKIVEAASTSQALVAAVRAKGLANRGVVAQYIPWDRNAIVVGMG